MLEASAGCSSSDINALNATLFMWQTEQRRTGIRENSKKSKAFQFLDANASVLNRSQLLDALVANLELTRKSAAVYASAWRKSNGVARSYTRRETGDDAQV